MAWSICSDRRSAFQTKTFPTDETKAALLAYRAEHETRLREAAVLADRGARGAKFYCGTLSGRGIPQPPFDLDVVIHMKPRDLPNVVAFREGWLVTARIREVIDQADPGVHGFWPVDLTWKNGTPVETPYWLLNIGAVKDTILEDGSDVIFRRNAEGFVYQKICRFETAYYPDMGDSEANILKKPLPIVLSKEAIGDSNLWTERVFGYKAPVTIVVTDSLYKALKAADAKVLRPEAYLPEA